MGRLPQRGPVGIHEAVGPDPSVKPGRATPIQGSYRGAALGCFEVEGGSSRRDLTEGETGEVHEVSHRGILT